MPRKFDPNRTPIFQRVAPVLAFLGLLLYGFFFASTGIDVTDTGFNLSNQWSLIQGGPNYNWGPIWLADLIGGVWIDLNPVKGLYGAIMGWCFLIAFNAAILCHFYCRHFPPVISLFVSLATGIIMTPGRLKILYYSNISGFFLMTASLACLNYFMKKDFSKKSLALTSLLMAAAFHSRLPSLLCLFCFPLIPVFCEFLKDKRLDRELLSRSGLLFITSVISVALLLIPVLLLGQPETYFSNIGQLLGFVENPLKLPEHSQSYIFAMLWKQLTWKPIQSVLILSLLILVAAFSGIQKKQMKTLAAVAVLILSGLFCYFLIPTNENDFRAIVATGLILSTLIGLILLFVQKNKFKEKEEFSDYPSMALFFLASPMIAIAGSPIGLLNFALGAWFLIPICALIFFLIFNSSENDKGFSGILLVCLLIPLAAKSTMIRYQSPYRDYMRRDLMTFEFKHQKLKNIRSLEGRVKSFGEFSEKVSELVKPQDTILAYNSIPLIYFMTETFPFLGSTWPTVLGPEKLRSYLDKAGNKEPPVYAFRALTNTQSHHWGNGVFVEPHNPNHFEAVKILDQWLQKQGYRQHWKNKDFMILKRD